VCVAVALGPSPSLVMINLGVVKIHIFMVLHPLLDLATFPPETSARAFLVELWIFSYSTEVDKKGLL
jgi:hypothetical protein